MKKEYNFDVLGLGNCAVDYVGVVPSFPRPDTKNRISKLIRQGGGPVATALVALARLGASVGYLGKLGNDELSRFVLEDFLREGVDVSQVVKEEGAEPTFAFILVDEKSGQRTIWWTDERVPRIRPEEIRKRKELFATARFLLLDEYQLEAATEAASLVKGEEVQVILDAESPEKQGIDKLIQLTDILIVPEEFASGFSGNKNVEASSQTLHDLGPSVVVITQGKKGSFCKIAKGSFHQDAFEVEVADTTGCGDVFHGGFVYGLLQSWPLEIVTEFASAVAALNCRRPGGRTATPTLKEVRGFLLQEGSMKIRKVMEENAHGKAS